MARLTFSGGIHPYDGKDMSKSKPIKDVDPKGELVYPLSQHIGAPAKPVVAKGDHVRSADCRSRGLCFSTDLCFGIRDREEH